MDHVYDRLYPWWCVTHQRMMTECEKKSIEPNAPKRMKDLVHSIYAEELAAKDADIERLEEARQYAINEHKKTLNELLAKDRLLVWICGEILGTLSMSRTDPVSLVNEIKQRAILAKEGK